MIEISGISKKYGKVVALDGVSLNIAEGECFALLGLNGSGKTTLINILSTSLSHDCGTAKIAGYDVLKERDEVRKIINISPQESAVAKNLTVEENLDLLASIYGVEGKDKKIDEIIEKFRLSEKRKVRCKKLSGGQMRRVSIALALITSPRVLFLDEPTLGLDVKARKILWDIIAELKGKLTILITTHYLEEVEFLADKIGILSRGKIKALGTLDEILKISNSENLESAFLSLAEEEQ